MNQIFWIFTSTIILCIAAYIFGVIKNNKYIISISEVIFISAAGGIILFSLKEYLPDSTHILKITIVSLLAIVISCLFSIFDSFKFCKYFGYLFLCFSLFCWINLYGSTFLIYKVSNSQKITGIICYSIFFLIIAVLLRKQKIYRIGFALVYYFPVALLHFTAFITIYGSRRPYSYVLTVGTSLLLVLITFQILKEAKIIRFNERILRIIKTILLASSEILITTSGLLMII